MSEVKIAKRFDLNTVLNQRKDQDRGLHVVGVLTVTGNDIGVGEMLFHMLPAKPGRFVIYEYHHALLAIPEGIRIKELKSFIQTGFDANAEIGSFAFIDGQRLRPYLSSENDQGPGTFAVGYTFPEFDDVFSYTEQGGLEYDAYYVYETDFDKPHTTNKTKAAQEDQPIAIFTSNGYGDSSFPIYADSSTGSYLIASMDLLELLNG